MSTDSNSRSSSKTLLRYTLAGILGIFLALGIWLGVNHPFQSTPTPSLTHLEAASAPSQTTPPDRQTKTQLPTEVALIQSTLSPVLPMTTRTPLITPTDYPIPSTTRRSNQEQNPKPSHFCKIIGYSVNGQPLEVCTFGSGDTVRLVIAGIHGGYEWNTIALADELIAHLEGHPDTVPPGIKLHVLRVLNPDGEARSHGFAGRANANGVDLNRNFPALWQAEWPRDGCWDYGPISAGPHPASEPETIALMNFIQAQGIDALISYHSAALGIFPGGQPPDDRSVSLAESIASVSNYPYPPIDTGCQFTGQLIDWASAQGIAAVDIELTDHQNIDFEQNLLILSRFLQWQP